MMDICQKWLGDHCSCVGARCHFLPVCGSVQRCDPHPC